MYNLVLTEDDMNVCLNALRGCDKLVYDVETSGLNFRKNHIVGYVLTVGAKIEDTFYVPVRHKGFNNCLNRKGLDNEEEKRVEIHPFEIEFARIAPSIKTVIGHNLGFDLLFSASKGIFFGGRTECTQTAMALINEYLPSFSLDSCAKYMGVTQKLGNELYFHMARVFGGEPDKKQMKNFWALEGNDPIATDYAAGDGVSTWELREAQEKEIEKQQLNRVWDVECRTTKTLFRMQYHGMKIDENELGKMSGEVQGLIEEAKNNLPAGLNINSAKQIKAWFDMEGITDYPITEKGNASFTADYLGTNEPGGRILKVRKLTTLIDRFITPLIEEHLIDGRISPNYNQLRGDDFGTVTGRLSCNNPNIQQVYKRDKWLGKIFRKVFIPDEGMLWASKDFSQCLAGDTKVLVPGGTKDISDLVEGDWVYSYTDDKTPVLKRVTRSGQTGIRKLYRVHWITNGRTKGYLDATDDHKIRMQDGSYETVAKLLQRVAIGKAQYPCGASVWAMRRTQQKVRGEARNYIFTDGVTRFKESRLVYENVNQCRVEEVHHIDGNCLNDIPSNLSGETRFSHSIERGARVDVSLELVQELVKEGLTQRQIAKKLKCSQSVVWKRLHFGNLGNHMITYIEELGGINPVYDITVEDTHNFIANEICVHNCEPRIYTHYSKSTLLRDGYLASPPVDFYQTLSNITGIPRSPTAGIAGNCKQLALAIFYGAGIPKTALMLGVSTERARQIRTMVQQMCPEIKAFSDDAQMRARTRGYVMTVLGRRARFPNGEYTNKAAGRIVQGGNADLIKLALCEVDDYLISQGLPPPIATVHDSIEVQFPEGRDDINQEVTRIMEATAQGGLINFSIPQIVDGGVGKNWSIATYGEE